MSKKIVGVLKPFLLKQDFYVYEDSNKIDMISITADEIISSIFELINKYSINQLDLIGPVQYTKGIGNKIKKEEINKYNKNIIEINYL